jgi:signal transduction histidine kinase
VERSARGLPLRVVGASADVSERRQLEESLCMADRLASLGALAAGVGHELNNPLAYVLTNLRFALDALQKQERGAQHAAGEEIVSALQDALGGAERMRTVVCDLRSIARPDDESAVAMVDVEATLDAAVRMVRTEILQRARLETEYRGLPPVRANAARLGQIFLNLLVNALQAIEPGAVDANLVRVTTALVGSEIVVSVQDTGCGIDPGVLPRIFDPFFTTKPVGTGTGLGLAISQRIARSSGGRLEVESVPDAGTTFRLVLPVAESLAPQAAPA